MAHTNHCQAMLSITYTFTVIDFVGDPITITLPRPGGGTNRQVAVNIPIIDDAINEHQETLVGFIEITEAIDTDTIILGRSAAQLIINDNDGNKTFQKHFTIYDYSCVFLQK